MVIARGCLAAGTTAGEEWEGYAATGSGVVAIRVTNAAEAASRRNCLRFMGVLRRLRGNSGANGLESTRDLAGSGLQGRSIAAASPDDKAQTGQ